MLDYFKFELPSISIPSIQLPPLQLPTVQLPSITLPQLPQFSALPPQAKDIFDKLPALKPEEARIVAYTALGISASTTLILLVRRAETASPALEITTLDDLNQYKTGGIFRDIATWMCKPTVVAIRVTGHGDRVPSLPRAICNLSALTELKVSDNAIAELPKEIGRLTGLQTLDIAGNNLISLPDELGNLTALVSLNAMNNQLESLPEAIGNLVSLQRLGLKGNRLSTLPASIGKLVHLKELFLTDNALTELPEEIGHCMALVKLQASHNNLRSLPRSLGMLPRLELLRVACCEITQVPADLDAARCLAWMSLAANPMCHMQSPRKPSVPIVPMKDVEIGRKLGDGASGEVFESTWKNSRRVALKVFREERSPDGHTKDEIAIACALNDKNLIRVLGRMEVPLGLVMEFVEGSPLADKPNHESLLRCRWPVGAAYDLSFVLRVVVAVASALEHMHSRGIAHGDVYAHNVIADDKGNAVLCDYGAAFAYSKNGAMAGVYEGHDVRAFGLLLRDMIERLDVDFAGMETTLDAQKQLLLLVQQCTTGLPAGRPRFNAITRKLRSLEKSSASGMTPRSDSRLSVKAEKAMDKLHRDGSATIR